MLDTKKGMKTINIIVCAIILIANLLILFGFNWRGSAIITNNIIFDNVLSNGITNTINNIVGNELFSVFLVNSFIMIMLYYLIICLPAYLYHLIKGCFK